MARIYIPYTKVLDLLAGPRQVSPAAYGPREKFLASLPCPASCLGSILGVELDNLSDGDRLTLVTLRESQL